MPIAWEVSLLTETVPKVLSQLRIWKAEKTIRFTVFIAMVHFINYTNYTVHQYIAFST